VAYFLSAKGYWYLMLNNEWQSLVVS